MSGQQGKHPELEYAESRSAVSHIATRTLKGERIGVERLGDELLQLVVKSRTR